MRPWLSCILICGAVCSLWIVVLAESSADDHGMPHAVVFDSAYVSHQPHFVMFYAPWFVGCALLSFLQLYVNAMCWVQTVLLAYHADFIVRA